MRFIKKIMFPVFALVLLAAAGALFGGTDSVRIIKRGAVLYSLPDPQSERRMILPLGAVLDVLKTDAGWVRVRVPFDNENEALFGFVGKEYCEFETAADPSKGLQSSGSLRQSAIRENSAFRAWELKINKAKGQSTTGVFLGLTGAVILVPSIFLSVHVSSMKSQNEAERRVSDARDFSIVFENLFLALAYLGDTVGVIVLTIGLSNYYSAQKQLKILQQEGAVKGYLRAGLVPKYGAVGFQVGAKF